LWHPKPQLIGRCYCPQLPASLPAAPRSCDIARRQETVCFRTRKCTWRAAHDLRVLLPCSCKHHACT
jgi:hypothetical protein